MKISNLYAVQSPSPNSCRAHRVAGKFATASITAGCRLVTVAIRAASFAVFLAASLLFSAHVFGTPFFGTPVAVPGTFEAENFDLGGQGIAYHDNTPGNQGGQYRLNEDVDIIVSSDALGGGYVVNNFETGEWLAYTINVAASAQYNIELRASSAFSTSTFHIEIDGQSVTGTVSVPNTGDWNIFQWVGKTGVSLAAGQHLLKIVADQQYFNLNSIRVTTVPSGSVVTPVPSGSVVTPVPSGSVVTPVPSGSANLLFSSGFEGTTALLPPSDFFGTGAWQNIVGVDSITGFAWPPNIWGGGSTHFQLIADAPVDATTIGNYMVNQIQTVTGHNGTPTQALYQQISQSGCCGTNPQGGGATQDPFMIQPVSETSDLYISYWLKYQPDLATNPNWRVVFEWKTAGDYRVLVELITWGGPPLSWRVLGDNNANGGLPYQIFWDLYNTTVPVPVGVWFKFEVFWHRSSGNDGRVWVAGNGQVIFDHYGPNRGVNNAPINRIMMPNLYSSAPYPIYQWVDDVQIWDGFPSDAAPH
jgi:hypothetical protein